MILDAEAWCWSMTAFASPKDARAAARAAHGAHQTVVKALRCPFAVDPPHWHYLRPLALGELEQIAAAVRTGEMVRGREPGPSASPVRLHTGRSVVVVTTKVIFRLPEERLAELDEAAKTEGRTRANFVQVSIERVLDQRRASSEAA